MSQCDVDTPGFLNIKILFPKFFLVPKYERKPKRWIDHKSGQDLSDTHEKINLFYCLFLQYIVLFAPLCRLFFEKTADVDELATIYFVCLFCFSKNHCLIYSIGNS
ncbi:MAG: hypothetical protein LBC33_02990 [Mycoplasmataceae bacterium]|nr:hypothetical protein [Mycoplasmataceae bacterium]